MTYLTSKISDDPYFPYQQFSFKCKKLETCIISRILRPPQKGMYEQRKRNFKLPMEYSGSYIEINTNEGVYDGQWLHNPKPPMHDTYSNDPS